MQAFPFVDAATVRLRRKVQSFHLAALFLAALALLGTSDLQAQTRGTVTGSVTHAQTGAALGGATVVVVGSQQGTVVRQDGSFRLELAPGTYELRVSQIGYAAVTESVTLTAGQTLSRNFQLQPSAIRVDEVVAIGTRRSDRTVINSPVPVDVLNSQAILSTGLSETSQILQRLAPSVNFPRTSIADGTDHMRPVTLRGLAPDQVLVLVNGKRRHNTALVHVNGTVGRGSTSVDLNAIPAGAIERIEVLRDGAGAQYGSDAIAGVVNIVLKGGEQQSGSFRYGQVLSSENGRDHRDGQVIQANGTVGTAIGQSGFLTLSGEFRDRQRTNRAYPDARPQYFSGDPRNNNPAIISSWQGDGDARDLGGFLNGMYPLGGIELYTFAGATYREGQAAGFFRRANDARTVRAIAPDGFLPEIASTIWDVSGAVGARGTASGWRWDLSSVYGGNSFRFDVVNSMNVSYGVNSPREFYAGQLAFTQSTTNLDLSRELDIGMAAPLNLAIGAEFRRDGYGIKAGAPNSYADGRVRVLDGPSAGAQPAIGSQVFPGFRPSDVIDVSRNNIAGYVDLETKPSDALLLNVAGRVERYSDFGTTGDGKVAARFEPISGFAVRGAFGTGFRAPSLGQSYFSSTATNFISGVPFDIRTFPVDSPGGRLLGSQDLKPEQSVNISAGMSIEPASGLVITADYYAINIDDRIVLSGNFTQPAVRALFEQQGLFGVGGGRFFTNAIDTETRGFDIVVNYGLLLNDASSLRFTAGYNQSKSEVTRVSSTPPALSAFQETLFDRVERGRIEAGQPSNNINLTANYAVGNLAVNLHNHRFGEVTSFNPRADGTLDQTFSAKWITDLDLSYRLPQQRLRISVGANNLLDVYPDEILDFAQGVSGALTTGGVYRFSAGVAPFGFNGRFVYMKLAYGL